MNSYSNIIFDLDGTLFKTDSVFIEAFSEVCLDRGIHLQDKKFINKLIGKPMTEICRLVFGEDIDDEDIKCIRNEVRKVENLLIPQKGMLYEGVIELIDKLINDGYTLCICSNGSPQYIDYVLCNFKIKDKFTIIKPRDEEFPKPQLIKQILDEMCCSSSIIVGDTNADFESADDTGCLSIGVSYSFADTDYEQADFIAHHPSDVYSIIAKINSTYKYVIQELLTKKLRNKPLMVGINGVDTSGITTFTKEISKILNKAGFKVQVIHQDDFHNPSNIRNKEPDPILSYYNNEFDLKYLENEIIEPISLNGCIDKEVILLDLQKDQYCLKKRYVVDKDTIVLIKGVLLYREPIDKYIDFKIYIDISFDEVIKRASKRDFVIFGDSVSERYQNKYIPIQKLYLEKCTPKDKSNIVIDNEDYMHPKILQKESQRKQIKGPETLLHDTHIKITKDIIPLSNELCLHY